VLLTGILPGTGAIGQLAYGRFQSPNYLTPGASLTPIGTRTGRPVAHGASTIYFSLFTPVTPKPATGWPVAIVGHGFGDSREGLPLTVAGSLARQGIATLAINVVGHGGGPLGTITVTTPTERRPVRWPRVDRQRPTDRRHRGVSPCPALAAADGLRQIITVSCIVRGQAGIDVDGDGSDLDRAASTTSQSFGGIYGRCFSRSWRRPRGVPSQRPGDRIIGWAVLTRGLFAPQWRTARQQPGATPDRSSNIRCDPPRSSTPSPARCGSARPRSHWAARSPTR
jgi:hypothetical protein